MIDRKILTSLHNVILFLGNAALRFNLTDQFKKKKTFI